jgi:hypothetical protein
VVSVTTKSILEHSRTALSTFASTFKLQKEEVWSKPNSVRLSAAGNPNFTLWPLGERKITLSDVTESDLTPSKTEASQILFNLRFGGHFRSAGSGFRQTIYADDMLDSASAVVAGYPNSPTERIS